MPIATACRGDDGAARRSALRLRAGDGPLRRRLAGPAERFDVVYNLLSVSLNQRVRVIVHHRARPRRCRRCTRSGRRDLVGARGLGPVRHHLLRPARSAPHPDRLRLRRSSVAQGFPADRLYRGPLRRGPQGGRLRTGAADPGFSQFRLPVAMGRHDHACRATRRCSRSVRQRRARRPRTPAGKAP